MSCLISFIATFGTGMLFIFDVPGRILEHRRRVLEHRRRVEFERNILAHQSEAEKLALEKHRALNEQLHYMLTQYSVACRHCSRNAEPICGTGNRYRCECGRQFANATHNIGGIPSVEQLASQALEWSRRRIVFKENYRSSLWS